MRFFRNAEKNRSFYPSRNYDIVVAIECARLIMTIFLTQPEGSVTMEVLLFRVIGYNLKVIPLVFVQPKIAPGVGRHGSVAVG